MKFLIKLSALILAGVTLGACSRIESIPQSPSVETLRQGVSTNASTHENKTPISAETPKPGHPEESNLVDSQPFKPSSPTENNLKVKNLKTTYQLNAVLDYERHLLKVEEKIIYTNQSQDTLDDLLLVIEPSRYPEVFHLKSITWGDGQPANDYERDIGQLRINLPLPLPPGDQVHLSIIYELDLPSPDSSYYGRPVPFGYSPRQTNLVDWYPFLPPYIDGQGWLVHQAGFFGEHLVYEIADFEVSIQLTNPNPDLVIAASAPAEKVGDTYRYDHREARSFAWSVSHMYEVQVETVGDVKVIGYSFPAHAAAGDAALKTTAQALQLYADLFGPYPHKTLSVVEADFLDGMEYDGLYFLSNGFYNLYSGYQGEYLIAIAAHETAHQWFYGLVGNDQALEPWLDEALCTYSERIYYEHYSPEALDWWYRYRVHYYNPRGWVDGSIYNPDGYRAYRDAVYLNGALFLDNLRNLMGDEAFFSFLRNYIDLYSSKIVSGDEFFEMVEQHAQADLTNLLQGYFTNKD